MTAVSKIQVAKNAPGATCTLPAIHGGGCADIVLRERAFSHPVLSSGGEEDTAAHSRGNCSSSGTKPKAY
jgi:hypothetical protein